MINWKSYLKANIISWLLEEDNPSVRYFTLIDLLEKPKYNLELIQTRKDILQRGIVPVIFSRQQEEGYWGEEEKYYTNKYRGTVWQLLILAESGIEKEDDARVEKACKFILEHAQDKKRYGFSVYHSAKAGGGRSNSVIPCLTGNMVFSLIRLGFYADERVQKAIQWIITYQRFDDGNYRLPDDWPYDKSDLGCWGKHSCHMGVVKTLKALAEIPINLKNEEINRTIEIAVDYLLKHHIYKKSHDLKKIAKPGWLRLGFPLMYQTDILEILEILTKLGYRDNRMQDAIDILISKQDNQGKWIMENTFNDRFLVNIEKKESLVNG
ncbi:MAG TPA: nitrogen fixation protein NifH [Atribacterota bacterium]|nr:nitrogen fixation protein NifH [Atribacterota bacterium]